jgi:carbon monoxide dehydrogenase subunit G
MRLEQNFEVPVPVSQAWEVLLDPARTASCLPGATLTGFDGETFAGQFDVVLGPLRLRYRGQGRFLERDVAAHRVALVVAGQDSGGAGGATTRITAVLHPAAGGAATRVRLVADVDLAGRAAPHAVAAPGSHGGARGGFGGAAALAGTAGLTGTRGKARRAKRSVVHQPSGPTRAAVTAAYTATVGQFARNLAATLGSRSTYEPSAYESPSYEPPSYEPPAYEAPAYTPLTSFEPPAYDPAAYAPLAFDPPAYEPPANAVEYHPLALIDPTESELPTTEPFAISAAESFPAVESFVADEPLPEQPLYAYAYEPEPLAVPDPLAEVAPVTETLWTAVVPTDTAPVLAVPVQSVDGVEPADLAVPVLADIVEPVAVAVAPEPATEAGLMAGAQQAPAAVAMPDPVVTPAATTPSAPAPAAPSVKRSRGGLIALIVVVVIVAAAVAVWLSLR